MATLIQCDMCKENHPQDSHIIDTYAFVKTHRAATHLPLSIDTKLWRVDLCETCAGKITPLQLMNKSKEGKSWQDQSIK